jgi:hypothetical protein
MFYDTFAMRDIDGNPMIAGLFPFFSRGETRRQLLARGTLVKVKSCWNGMGTPPNPTNKVSLNAVPFQNESRPLRFRAIPGSLSIQNGYLEGSEACLINADMQAHWSDVLTGTNVRYKSADVFVNPLVRVSYTTVAHNAQNSISQLFRERIFGHFVALAFDIRDWWVRSRLNAHAAERRAKIHEWEETTGEKEVGEYCLIDQMQLLTPWGWAHI